MYCKYSPHTAIFQGVDNNVVSTDVSGRVKFRVFTFPKFVLQQSNSKPYPNTVGCIRYHTWVIPFRPHNLSHWCDIMYGV